MTYGYDDVGRFETVAWTVGAVSQTATYSYLTNTNLIERLTTGDGLNTSYTYDPKRNLKTRVKNEFGENLISQYDYTYDALGLRKSVMNSGQAFATPAFNHYNYNDRNELVESSRHLGADLSDTSNPVQSEYRAYEYDPIGNRVEIVQGADAIAYNTNMLNQYTSLTGPSPETLAYDADGNLKSTSSGVNYVYNAENRLIVVEPQNPVEGDARVEFKYDSLVRRVQKNVSLFTRGSWSLKSEIKFIFYEWSLR
ncbi:MAG: hypothetical protein GY866_40030, partial [Proteobacteria bacterium]|nr:hypothetical protein [Pseudomonadota bacterium]